MIAIIGGGVAGLACARELAREGRGFRLYEASPRVGGRVATDTVGGFLIDRGFQVLLDSYAGVRPFLRDLDPCYFESGAILQDRGRKWTVRNPLFHPASAPASGLTGAFSSADKVALLGLVAGAISRSDRALLASAGRNDDKELLAILKDAGVSPAAVERFFRPFFGGVFLDDSLSASASLFRFYLKKFALGRAFVPRRGAGRLPALLAKDLPGGAVRTGCRVEGWELSGQMVSALRLDGGERVSVDQAILAMGPGETARFLGMQPPPTTSVTTLCLAGDAPLYRGKLIVLPAGRKRVVRHFVQFTNVNPSAAPDGRHLVMATLLANAPASTDSIRIARREIAEIFPAIGSYELVDFRVTREATILSRPGDMGHALSLRLPANVTLAGDLAGWSCIESSLACGRRAMRDVKA